MGWAVIKQVTGQAVMFGIQLVFHFIIIIIITSFYGPIIIGFAKG